MALGMLRYLAFGGFALGVVVSATGCSGKSLCGGKAAYADGENAGQAPSRDGANIAAPAPANAAEAQRAVAEADIVQLDGNRVYAMSKSGTLAIVDASQPGQLALLSKTRLPGQPFEMYRRGNVLVVMANQAVSKEGVVIVSTGDESAPLPAPDPAAGALVVAVDVSDPAAPKTLEPLVVPGEIADSRTVGNVLYLATYENTQCYHCSTSLRTLVTSFDIALPNAPKEVAQVAWLAPQGTVYNLAWSTAWRRSIVATNERLYVGGLADTASATTPEGVIEVVDITDPSGALAKATSLKVAGPVLSRWQMDETAGVFRVISQRGAGSTSNGSAPPEVDTFRIDSMSSFAPLGHMTLTLPRPEGLKTVRFDGSRAYAITFNQTDPLFTIDLSNPAAPIQRGEILMPGWTFHLVPKGDKLLGLGLDRTDKTGNLNVSLFDVADLAAPKMLQRVSFGPTNLYEDYQITNGVLAEDQDRIQKAFRIFPDGLISVPFSAPATSGYATDTCSGSGGGIQLLDWNGATTLTKRALLSMAGNPRRALRRQYFFGGLLQNDEILGVSDSNVTAFDIDSRDTPQETASVVIGTCVPRTNPTPTPMPQGDYVLGGQPGGYDYAYGTNPRGGSGSGSGDCF